MTTITYIRTTLDINDAKRLKECLSKNGIKNITSPDKMHCTLLYSQTPIKDIQSEDIFPLNVTPLRFEIWDVPGHSPHLVLRLQSVGLTNRHNQYIEAGGTHDFDTFNPHITVCKDIPLDFDLEKLFISSNEIFDNDLILTDEKINIFDK